MSTNNYTITDNTLRFSNTFNKSLGPYRKILRNTSITHLELGSNFSQKLVLPPNITSLTLGNNFNRPFVLTKYITDLTIGNQFNQRIVSTENVKNLRFGEEFDQPLILGSRVEKLVFDNDSMFDHPIVLNENLVSVVFGSQFNQPLVLSRNLEELWVGYCFDCSIIFSPKLKRLIFDEHCYYNEPLVLGKTIVELCLGQSSVQSIELYKNVRILNIHNAGYGKQVVLNKYLSELVNYSECVGELSKNISYIQFKHADVRGVLPKRVKHVSVGFVCDKVKYFYLPPYLEYVNLGDTCNKSIVLEHGRTQSSLTVCDLNHNYPIIDNLLNGTCKVIVTETDDVYWNNMPNSISELKIKGWLKRDHTYVFQK